MMSRFLYNTTQKLWVKYNQYACKVSTVSCEDIDDFKDSVKKKVFPDLVNAIGLTLHKSLNEAPLKPNQTISSLAPFGSCYEMPLIIKVSPTEPHVLEQKSKTILVQEYGEDYQLLDSFTEATIWSDADVKQILGSKGEALMKLSGPKRRIIHFHEIEDGEKYKIYSSYLNSFSDEVRWQQTEDEAMEEEICLAMKSYLNKNLGQNVKTLPTDIKGSNGNYVQEWDGIFKVNNIIYLCEAKHVMTSNLKKMTKRILQFKEIQANAPSEICSSIDKIVAVACGTYFPEDVRKEAYRLGFLCVYPSGNRYCVNKEIEFKLQLPFMNK